MQKIKYIILGASLIFFFISCLKDEGNYSYMELPDFYIDTVGEQNLFEVRQSLENLTINPKVVFDGPESDLIYQWRLYAGTGDIDTLGFEKVLNSPILRNPGTYNVELQVTRTSNNLSALMRYQVAVVPPVPSGWMVAYETGGNTDVDIIRSPEFINGVEETVLRNVFSTTNGYAVPGIPVSLFYINNDISYVYTSSGGVKVQNTDFRQVQDFAQMFIGGPPEVVKPQAFWPGSYYAGAIVNDGDIYWMQDNVFVGKVIVDELGYEAAPFIYFQFVKYGGFYDQLNMRFLMAEQLTSQGSKYVDANPSARFNLNNIGKKLLFIERGFGLTAGDPHKYAFFEDVDGNGRHLYAINTSTPLTPDLAAVDISSAPEIFDAQFYAVGNLGPCAFYATSKTVYNFTIDYTENVISSPIAGFEVPVGEEITCLRLFKGHGRDSGVGNINTPYDSRFMYVATWNGSEGKVYLLDVNVTSGELSAPVKFWTVGGKVLDMHYKQS